MGESDNGLEKKIEEIEAKLQEYTASKGVAKNNKLQYKDIEEYIQMDRKELRSLSEEDCGEIAYLLGQTSLEVQREINEKMAISKWLDAQITRTVADLTCNYKNYSYEGNRNAAIKDNDFARKANDLKTRIDVRVMSLQYIAQEVKNLSSIILSIRDTKRRNNQNA
jgi:hypothetical protein